MHFHEHLHRSLAKAITFRLFVLVSDAIIVYSLTQRYDVTAGAILFSNIASTILYVAHERIWNEIHWGKSKLNK